jgi:hypothetical protein
MVVDPVIEMRRVQKDATPDPHDWNLAPSDARSEGTVRHTEQHRRAVDVQEANGVL